MSFLSDDPIHNEQTNSALEGLMKTEEGREIAQQIKDKLKQLSETFQALNDGDKEEFATTFKNKFKDSFGNLKVNVEETLKSKVGDADFREEFKEKVAKKVFMYQNYNLAIVAFIVFLAIFGFFGYKLYTSIMLKEQKRLAPKLTKEQKKELKKEGKKTPASPNGKATVSPKKGN